MGIPSYFNHILKNHNSILQQTKHVECHYLFIDANSLIYDSVHEMKDIHNNTQIYDHVYNKIINMVKQNNPMYKTYVCFDGLPPLPKIMQQKQRRFKSQLTKKILNTHKETWNTNKITPGTDFMNELDEYFVNMFKFNKNIVFSGPKENGEGEHKIRRIMQNNKQFIGKNCVIYGLDADLIMIGLLLNTYNHNIFLFKETHHFSYIPKVDENKYYYFNIGFLSKEIHNILKTDSCKQSILDYCFICFFCGNDFMPHLPSINLRNNGISRLIECYAKIQKKQLIDIQDLKINWVNVRDLIYVLMDNEEQKVKENLLWKLSLKSKIRVYNFEDKLNHLPVMDNEKEEYLLHNINEYNTYVLDEENVKNVCLNYLEILEWTWYYYIGENKDNTIYYKYNYGPLFTDLCNYIPITNGELFIQEKKTPQINEITQLYYVLPTEDHYSIIPNDIYEKTNKIMYQCFDSLKNPQYNIDYFLCRYFWESHFHFYNDDIHNMNSLLQKII
jgi:5'-3' exonuclease